MSDQREVSDQLDLFRQPRQPDPTVTRAAPCGCKWYSDGPRFKCVAHRGQLTELAGESWEDAFGDAA